MTTEPQAAPTIPFYKSTVTLGVLVSLAFKGLAVVLPDYAVPGEMEEEAKGYVLLAISAVGDFVALIARLRSNVQPISATQSAADTANRM